MKRRAYIRKSSGKHWRPREDARLRALFRSSKDALVIKLPGRTPSAILNRARVIGLMKTTRLWWNTLEDEWLRREFEKHRKDPSKITIIGRKAGAIQSRRSELGLSTREYWTEEQILELRDQWSKANGNRSDVVVAGKTVAQIYSKLDHLGLLTAKRKRCKWSKAKIALLKRKIASTADPRLITIPGFTPSQIRGKLFRIGGKIPRVDRWTKDQDESLTRQWHAANDLSKIVIPGRTIAAVTARLKQLGLLKPSNENWSATDLALLRQQWEKFRDVDRLLIPGRSRSQILRALQQLRLLKTPRWTKSQLAKLRSAWNRTKDVKTINIPGRTRTAIKAKLIQLNIDVRNGSKKPWTATQIKSLKAQWQLRKDRSKVKIRGKSASAITAQLRRLGLIKPRASCSEWSLTEQVTVLELRLQGKNAKQIALARASSRTTWGIAKWLSRLKKKNLLTKEHLESLKDRAQVSKRTPEPTAELNVKPLSAITELLPPEFKDPQALKPTELALPGAIRRRLAKLSADRLTAIAKQLLESLSAPPIALILHQVETTRMKGSTAFADSLQELNRRLADPLLGSAKSSRVALVDAIVVCAYIPNHALRLIS
jgi:hypothetical protein